MTPDEWLLAAAKRAKKLIEAQIDGTYYGPSEDVQCGRELAAAIAAVEEARLQRELVDRR